MSDRRMDEYLQGVAALVEQHGWAVQAVFGDQPGEAFSYTVGLTDKGLPELWLGSIGPDAATEILNACARWLLAAGADGLVNGAEFDAEFSVPFRLRGPCSLQAAEVKVAQALHPLSEVAVWQVLWPDEAGLFPADEGYDTVKYPQRLLGRA